MKKWIGCQAIDEGRMACLFRRNNGIFYIVFSDGKNRRWFSTGEKDFKSAEQVFHENKDAFKSQRLLTISGFLKLFLQLTEHSLSSGTKYLYSISFRHLISAVGDRTLKFVRTLDVERFKVLRATKVSPVRVNIELRTLKAAFSRAVSWGLIQGNPFQKCTMMRVPVVPPAYFTREEFKNVLQTEEDPGFRNLLVFAVSTMMRVGEIVSLEWDDIDFSKRLIYIRNKQTFTLKGGRPRVIPMSEMVFRILRDKEKKSNFAFHGKDSKKLQTRTVSRRFKKLVRASGLSERLHFHSLRHTGASWLVQQGVPLYEIQTILGHSSPSVTQIYSHLTSENLRESVEKLFLN